MKTFKKFLEEMTAKSLPVYKMQMNMLNKKVNALQKYKRNPSLDNFNNLKKANELSLKIQDVMDRAK